MKIEQEIMEMFDKEPIEDADIFDTLNEEQKKWFFNEMKHIKSFISQIITLVQKREREEMVERVQEYAEPYEGSKWLNQVNAEKIINLIKQNDKTD